MVDRIWRDCVEKVRNNFYRQTVDIKSVGLSQIPWNVR